MFNPARFSLARPRIVVLSALLLLIYGALSYQGIPRQENPTLKDRFASVVTYLPGADPERVELLVTDVLEDRIAELDDIHQIFSTSHYGKSVVVVEVEKSAPVGERLQQIREKVQEARASFPDRTPEPEVDTRMLRTNTVVLALTSGGGSPLALREQAQELERELERLADVRRVELVGLPREEIEVAVDLQRLSQSGIPLSRVVEVLAARNIRLPSGELGAGPIRSSVHTSGAFELVAEVGHTFLATREGELPIRLRDVATVTRQLAEPDVTVRANGSPAVGIAVEMLPGRNAVALGEAVRALAEAYQQELPEGMEIRVVADEPTYVRDRLTLLTASLLGGLGLVVVLTLSGMGWRSGLVVSASIPIALTVAMGFQGIAGIALHQISIAALVIAIGIIVDEAIVVTDSIQRHLDRGRSPRQAAVEGLGEIHLAVLAGAATTVAAFIPLMVMSGDVGDFIRSIPLVVSVMLLASVLVAHFVTPLLMAWVHRRGQRDDGPSRAEHRLQRWYGPVLRLAVGRPRVVLALFATGIALSLLGARVFLWPPAFFPDADRNQFLIRVHLPTGAALAETETAVRAIEARLARDPDLADWTAFVGADAPKFYYNEFHDGRARNRAQVVVNTRRSVPFHETARVVARVDRDLKGNVAGALVRSQALKQGYASGDAIEVFVLGDDLHVLRVLTARAREIVEAVPGVVNVRDTFGYDPIAIRAEVQPAKANLLGITHRSVATTLRTALDGVTATTFRENDEEIDIRVRLPEARRRGVTELAELPLYSPAAGSAVPLAHVAHLEAGWNLRSIHHYNREREAFVVADLAPGHALVAVADAVERAVREQLTLPPGYDLAFFGQRQEVTESFLSLAQAAVVAVFLIYIILVLRFQSLHQPLLILLAVPMALAGSCWGLAATGHPLSLMAFLGMISLTGIAVNDSIVLIDTINRRRAEGLALEEAVSSGARTRLRAVLLTSITTIGGLLPLSLRGGAFWAPFGFAMIFGLAASTLLTLAVQPAAYLALERRRGERAR